MNREELRINQGLSEGYWNTLSDRDKELYALIRPAPGAKYEVDVHLHHLANWVAENHRDMRASSGGIEMNPDFQRGHVWTQEQKVAYCEAFMRGQAPALLLFNCPSYMGGSDYQGDIPKGLMQCIDGLQRYTALTEFAAGKIAVFGGLTADDLKDGPFSLKRYRVRVKIYAIPKREDLLRLYIQLNEGGTQHTKDELDRVRGLLSQVSGEPASKPRKAAKP